MTEYREDQLVRVTDGYRDGEVARIKYIEDDEVSITDYMVEFEDGEEGPKRDRSIELLKCPKHKCWLTFIEGRWRCLFCRD